MEEGGKTGGWGEMLNGQPTVLFIREKINTKHPLLSTLIDSISAPTQNQMVGTRILTLWLFNFQSCWAISYN